MRPRDGGAGGCKRKGSSAKNKEKHVCLSRVFLAKSVANISATGHGKVGKEVMRYRALYLGFRGLLASISGKHGEREVGNTLKKLGGRKKNGAHYLLWRALGGEGSFL